MGSVEDIITAAKRRRAVALADTLAALSDDNRRVLAAHLGFVLLDATMCTVAEKLIENGFNAELMRMSSAQTSLRIGSSPKCVACELFLGNAEIVIRFLGSKRPDWEQRWSPPSTDMEQLHMEAIAYAPEFAAHLTAI